MHRSFSTKTLLATGWMALVSVVSSEAGLVLSGVQNVSIPDTFEGIYLDFTNSADPTQFTITTSFAASLSWDLNFVFGGAVIADSPTLNLVRESGDVTNSTVHNLAPGTLVDAGSVVYDGGSVSSDHIGTGPPPAFNNGTRGYLGFVLNPGVDDYPGWMEVTLNQSGGGTIHQWAWETTSISAGGSIAVVPEPSGLFATMVAFGCASALHRRRTKWRG